VVTGCGFIGRNLVGYLLDNDLVSYLRVVDKVPPQTAWFNVEHQRMFEHPLLEFKSANLINIGNYDQDISKNRSKLIKSIYIYIIERKRIFQVLLLAKKIL